MADKKNKRPRHTRIVVPGQSKAAAKEKKTREHKAPAAPKAEALPQEAPKAPDAQQAAPGNVPPTAGPALPPKVLALPRTRKDNPRITAVRRRKRRHRLQALGVFMAFVLLLVFFVSGAYVGAVRKGSEWMEGIRIGLQGGEGFPLEFELPGYQSVRPVGSGGFAVLGEKDLAIVSAKGLETYRVQHGYASPQITTGNTRVCVYNRGGNSYAVEGRDRRLVARTTEDDAEILFAEMSPGGHLALVTALRYNATLRIYGYALEDEAYYEWSWPMVDGIPYRLTFHSDNKHFSLANVTTQEGAVATDIYLLHTGREDVQGRIHTADAVALRMEYLSANRLLVVYESFAAVYDGKGTEVARYEYNGRTLVTEDSAGGTTALVFLATSHNRLDVVVLDSSLRETGSFSTTAADSPSVLVNGRSVAVLSGYQLFLYTTGGDQLPQQTELSQTAYGLIKVGNTSLAILAGQVVSLPDLMSGAEGSAPEADSASAEAVAGADSLPEGEPVNSAPDEGQPEGSQPEQE